MASKFRNEASNSFHGFFLGKKTTWREDDNAPTELVVSQIKNQEMIERTQHWHQVQPFLTLKPAAQRLFFKNDREKSVLASFVGFRLRKFGPTARRDGPKPGRWSVARPDSPSRGFGPSPGRLEHEM